MEVGIKKLKVKTVLDLKKKIPTLHEEISTLTRLQPIYQYAFELFKDQRSIHKIMEYNVAELLWAQLISKAYPYSNQWKDFISVYKNSVSRLTITNDTWVMFFQFMVITSKDITKINNVIKDGVWPNIIEEFAKALKANLNV